jgi:hypothetical protein
MARLIITCRGLCACTKAYVPYPPMLGYNGHACLFIGNYMRYHRGMLIVCGILILSYAGEEICSSSWSDLEVDHGMGQMSSQGEDFDELV